MSNSDNDFANAVQEVEEAHMAATYQQTEEGKMTSAEKGYK